MRVAYIHAQITCVQIASAMTGATMAVCEDNGAPSADTTRVANPCRILNPERVLSVPHGRPASAFRLHVLEREPDVTRACRNERRTERVPEAFEHERRIQMRRKVQYDVARAAVHVGGELGSFAKSVPA